MTALCCSFCDAPVESDWCPKCRELTGSYDPDTLPYVGPSRIERMLASKSLPLVEIGEVA